MIQIEYKIIKAGTTMCEEEMNALGVRGWGFGSGADRRIAEN